MSRNGLFVTTLLFFASFSSALAAPGGLEPLYGRWTHVGDRVQLVACQEGGSHMRSAEAAGFGGIALFGKPCWRDYRASVRVVSGTDVPNVLLRVCDPWNCVQFGRYGSALRLYLLRGGDVKIVTETNGGPSKFPETLTAEIRGNAVRCYSNGRLVLQHTFRASEIPAEGKAGLQANHPSATFDRIETQVFRANPTPAGRRDVRVLSLQVQPGRPGLNRVVVRVRDSAGAADVAAVTCEALAVTHPLPGTRTGRTRLIPIPTEPLQALFRAASAARKRNETLWEGRLFALHAGDVRLHARVEDRSDNAYGGAASVTLKPTAEHADPLRLHDGTDPHPVWRGHELNPAADGPARPYTNYLWSVAANRDAAVCHAQVIEPAGGSHPYIGRRILVDDPAITVRPRLVLADGRVLSGSVRRVTGVACSLFGVQPTWEMTTSAGRLVWWVRILNGDPILRFGGTFTPTRDVRVSLGFEVKNGYRQVERLGGGAGYRVWRVGGRVEAPVFCEVEPSPPDAHPHPALRAPLSPGGARGVRLAADSPRPLAGEGAGGEGAVQSTIDNRQSTIARVLPFYAIAIVDANAKANDIATDRAWAAKLARYALAVPEVAASYRDLGGDDRTCRLAIERPYRVAPNARGVRDPGQFMALPWSAGTHVAAGIATGTFHTAFGKQPYAIVHGSRVVLDLPLPDLNPATLTPDYEPLTGDWLDKAVTCLEQVLSLQEPDGSFRKYDRMDHYSLGRMTLGLMVGYRGMAGNPALQARVGRAVRRALARMMGENPLALGSGMSLRKGFTGGADLIEWKRGVPYEPFTYAPQWDVYTEMGSFVDQNLGHAHLLYTLLLYGHYVDPGYLRRPEVQARLRELIHYQWMSQDWNGDIWRVFVGGYDAAGGGDGFEEDLAMMLPRLADDAGLSQPWRQLARRIAALKYGALREFDYLPVLNEWGYEFLTPMHHATEWTPESGWGRGYLGDVWYTGPAVTSGIYGPWYVDDVYRGREDVWAKMWYDLLEEAPRDPIVTDTRHWLTIGGFCSEARLVDPFLGAVKLMRAHTIALRQDYLTQRTDGENIWNFAFYPAAMAMINHEMLGRYPWMRGATPVADAVTSSDPDHAPAYAWRTADGAVISVAACRTHEPTTVTVTLDAAKLGPTGTRWSVEDARTGARPVVDGGVLTVTVAPRSATTLRIASAPPSPR